MKFYKYKKYILDSLKEHKKVIKNTKKNIQVGKIIYDVVKSEEDTTYIQQNYKINDEELNSKQKLTISKIPSNKQKYLTDTKMLGLGLGACVVGLIALGISQQNYEDNLIASCVGVGVGFLGFWYLTLGVRGYLESAENKQNLMYELGRYFNEQQANEIKEILEFYKLYNYNSKVQEQQRKEKNEKKLAHLKQDEQTK